MEWRREEVWSDEAGDYVEVRVLEVEPDEQAGRYGVDVWEYRMGYKDSGQRFSNPEDATEYARLLLLAERTQQARVVDYQPDKGED